MEQQTTSLQLIDLAAAVVEARHEMIAAWKAQSVTTVAEGCSYEQADAALAQAVAAQEVYTNLAHMLETSFAAATRNVSAEPVEEEWGMDELDIADIRCGNF